MLVLLKVVCRLVQPLIGGEMAEMPACMVKMTMICRLAVGVAEKSQIIDAFKSSWKCDVILDLLQAVSTQMVTHFVRRLRRLHRGRSIA